MRPFTRSLATSLATVVLASPLSTVQAQITTFSAFLSGAQEDPPNPSPGTGEAIVTLDQFVNTMRVRVNFSGLIGTTTVAHIHCCTADPFVGNVGVATTTPTFPGFPAGVTSGAYDVTFDMLNLTSYRPGFVMDNGGTAASAFSALSAGMFAGKSYFNLHSTVYPGGEIRGFLQVVPEPGTYALMAAGLLGLGVVSRRRRA